MRGLDGAGGGAMCHCTCYLALTVAVPPLSRLEPLSNELLGQVVDAAVAAGGNDLRINSVSTGLSRATLRRAQSEARVAAVRDALTVARELAEAAGQALGPVLSLTDGVAGEHPVPTPRMFAAHAAAGAPTPVVVSETSVTARVSAVVALA